MGRVAELDRWRYRQEKGTSVTRRFSLEASLSTEKLSWHHRLSPPLGLSLIGTGTVFTQPPQLFFFSTCRMPLKPWFFCEDSKSMPDYDVLHLRRLRVSHFPLPTLLLLTCLNLRII